MLELILIIIVIALVVIAVKLAKKPTEPAVHDGKSSEQLLDEANQVLDEASHLMLLMEVKRQAEEHNDTTTVQAVLNMTYNGPMPELQPDGSYSSIYADYLRYNIAGINYREGIADYVGKFTGYLHPEATNQHDPNAIAVYHHDGHHLGYIPADSTDDIRALGVPFPIPVDGEIEENYDENDEDNKPHQYFIGTVYVEIPSKNK